MKKQFFLILVLFVSSQMFAQKQIAVTRTVKTIDTVFSVDKLYHKKTSKKISKKEFEKLVKKNPNLPIERIFDNKGNIVKYLYDPENSDSIRMETSGNEKIEIGGFYPELILKTLDGDSIRIKDLRGKMVILRFELEADTFRFKKHEIKELDEGINQTQRASEIESIIIFNATRQQIKKGFDLVDSNFKLIPNGGDFQNLLHIKSFPSTIILDKEGKLMEEISMSSDINILALLNRS